MFTNVIKINENMFGLSDLVLSPAANTNLETGGETPQAQMLSGKSSSQLFSSSDITFFKV